MQIPSPGKILEKLVNVYLYFDCNNLLCEKLCGFRQGRSASQCIFDVLKTIYDD